jgi:hypothetical protein
LCLSKLVYTTQNDDCINFIQCLPQ